MRGLLERRPDHVPALLFLGRLLFETDRPQRAREVLERVAEARPARAGAVPPPRGDGARGGPPRRGGAHGPGARRPEPGHHRAQAAGGGAARPRRARDRPCAPGAKTVQIDPGDAEAQGALGEALEALGRSADAEAAYGRALERDPDAREVLLRAGRLALRSGSEPRARAYLDRLASLDGGPEQSLRIALTWLVGREGRSRGPGARAGARRAATIRACCSRSGLVQGKVGRWADAARAYGAGACRRRRVEGRGGAAGPRAGPRRGAGRRRAGHGRGARGRRRATWRSRPDTRRCSRPSALRAGPSEFLEGAHPGVGQHRAGDGAGADLLPHRRARRGGLGPHRGAAGAPARRGAPLRAGDRARARAAPPARRWPGCASCWR